VLLISRRELGAADGRVGEPCRRSESYRREVDAASDLAGGTSSKLNVFLGSNEVRLDDDPLRGGSSLR
jgi:hypothetical protein